ncbi:MAG: hypothetical protein HN919_03115 [Verrucomicrobia bacterium]|jgi:hypothetical protein|nr:hypothetical protein [Verrucomicrobiota bacterium]MBT7065267.1 hypothetical protein [Verrucomicrobiota bacterium]MBT7700192.1 hypothetical protein [Verrucomicrobiota bacterium]
MSKTGKCKKADQSLKALDAQVAAVTEHLICVYDVLAGICKKKPKAKSHTRVQELKQLPVKQGGLDFYIQFALVADDAEIEGAIVYGASREPCYPNSLWPNPDKKQQERPLACFFLDSLGKVSIKGKLQDEWWLTGTEADTQAAVEEMHYRVLDMIWRDALNWTNEPLLP